MKVFIEEKFQKLIILNLILKVKLLSLFQKKKNKDKNEELNESDKKKIKKLIKNKSVKDIVRIFSQEKNISKSKIYNYCLKKK